MHYKPLKPEDITFIPERLEPFGQPQIKATPTPDEPTPKVAAALRCAFCHDRDQGKHGEVKREWSPEHRMFFNVCRTHVRADGMIDGVCPTCQGRKLIIPLGYQGEPWDCPTCVKGDITIERAVTLICEAYGCAPRRGTPELFEILAGLWQRAQRAVNETQRITPTNTP